MSENKAKWQKEKDNMSATRFNTDYDRTEFATVDDVVSETGKSALLISKALKDSGLASVGYVHTGRVGKPPRLFKRSDFLSALKEYEERHSALRAARSSSRVRVVTKTTVNTVPPPANDDVRSESTAEAVVFGE